MKKGLVIIPTYNERDNLPILLERVHKALDGVNYEVIIVDDDSPDGTWTVAERFSHKFGNIKVVKRLKKWVSPQPSSRVWITLKAPL